MQSLPSSNSQPPTPSQTSPSNSSEPPSSSTTCQSCRKLHRKCDKLLPSCSYCLKRGYICCYEKTKDEQSVIIRKKANLNYHHHTTPNNNNNFNANFVNNTTSSASSSSAYEGTFHYNNSNNNQLMMMNHDNNNNNFNVNNNNQNIGGGGLSGYRSNPYQSTGGSSLLFSSSSQRNASSYNVMNPMMMDNGYQQQQQQHAAAFVNIANMFNQQMQMNYRLVTNQTLDIYYQYLSNGFPMVERRVLERVLEYNAISANDYSVNNAYSSSMVNHLYNSVSDFEKDQCLLFTLQALCLQQLGQRETANAIYANARQIMGKYFDDLDSQSMMVAMTFMGLFLIGEGEKNKAKNILASVASAIAPYKNPMPAMDDFQVGNNSNAFSLPSTTNQDDEDTISEWVITQPKCFTSFLVDTQLRGLEAYFGEEENPKTYILDGFEALGNNNLNLAKLREMIPDCRVLSKEAVDSLLSLLPAMECLAQVVLTNFNRTPTLKLLYSLLFKQVHLAILKNAEESIRDIPQLLTVCSQVIELTRDELFPFLPIAATKPIITAATLRVQYFNSLDSSENFNDDLRALKTLSKNFKAIQTGCGPLMKALESLIYLQQRKSASDLESIFDFGEDVFSIESIPSRYSSPSSSNCSKENLTPQTIFDSYQSEFAPLFKDFGIDMEVVDVFIKNMSEQEKLYQDDRSKLAEKRMELVEAFKSISGKKKDVFGIVACEFLKKQLFNE